MRRSTLPALLAMLTFFAAWFLPLVADYTPEHAGPPGWDAFLTALGVGPDYEGSILSVSSALTNGLMLAALAALLSRRIRVPRWAGWVMVGAAVLNSGWAWWPAGYRLHLAAGYWLWEASFCWVAVLLLRRTRRRAPLPAV